MIVMTGNNTVFNEYGFKNAGLLMSPPRFTRCPNPYALDNRRYACAVKKIEWSFDLWINHLDKAAAWEQVSGNSPLWVLVPDLPFDFEGTNQEWKQYSPIVKSYGFKLAFAAQNGHTPKDIPSDADVVFIGGDTDWKRQNISIFCKYFENVHVGRINTARWLWVCHHAGAKSIDGTGWIWKGKPEYQQLVEYLEIVEGKRKQETGSLFPLGNFVDYGDIKGTFQLT